MKRKKTDITFYQIRLTWYSIEKNPKKKAKIRYDRYSRFSAVSIIIRIGTLLNFITRISSLFYGRTRSRFTI
jgi:hypothetical protein